MFRGSRGATAVTRAVTFSEFDHVAIVLRLADETDVHFIEATGGPGVTLNRWDNIKKHIGEDKFYNKIVYRKVNFNDNHKILDEFWDFCKEAMGHKYALSVDKLTRQKTIGVKKK